MQILVGYSVGLGFLFLMLSVRTILLRGRFGVALGDGQQKLLQRAIRAHANFAEYVPITLVLLFFLTQTDLHLAWFHGLGATLLLGRIAHAWALSHEPEPHTLRVLGMVCTFGSLGTTLVLLALKTWF